VTSGALVTHHLVTEQLEIARLARQINEGIEPVLGPDALVLNVLEDVVEIEEPGVQLVDGITDFRGPPRAIRRLRGPTHSDRPSRPFLSVQV